MSAIRVYGYAPSALQQAFSEAGSRCRVTQLWIPDHEAHGLYTPTRAQWLPDWHGIGGGGGVGDLFGAQPGMALDGLGAQGWRVLCSVLWVWLDVPAQLPPGSV